MFHHPETCTPTCRQQDRFCSSIPTSIDMPPPSGTWSRDLFQPTERKATFIGLGTVDTKSTTAGYHGNLQTG